MSRGAAVRLGALALCLSLLLGLAGCKAPAKPAETTIFAMDTVMNLTVCGEEGQSALEAAVDTIYRLDTQLGVTDPGSAVFALNNAAGEWTAMDEETFRLLQDSLALCAVTGGALDLTAYSAVRAWGFTTGDYRVPTDEELSDLAGRIDFQKVELDEETASVRLPEGMAMDLGAVAKGYAGDVLTDLLTRQGVTSALLDLGQSTIQAVGAKPNGSAWRIGIQDPDSDGYLGVVELEDAAMGTSGGYQRFFTENGQTYWHIIDPDTAAPARSGLASVTVVAKNGLLCDGLSTALFVMGQEQALDFYHAHPELGFEALFIRQDGSIALTAGLEESFELAQGQEGRAVEVLP